MEEVRHIFNGGLSNDDYRTLRNTVENYVVVLKEAQRVATERPTASAAAKSTPQCAFYRVGDYWEITFAGRETRLKGSDGLRYIHYLVARPNTAVGVQELRPLGSRQHRPDPDVLQDQARERSIKISDRRAVEEYSAEINRLEQEIARAHEAGDHARASKLRTDVDAVERELRQAHRPLDRVRKKAQEAVRKRIVAAFKAIDQEMPLLAEHLRKSIRTGYECQYSPDAARPIEWVLMPPDSRHA